MTLPPRTRMREKYEAEVFRRLREQYKYGNVMQVPRLTKIVVNIGLGEALTDANALDKAADDVSAITGQKPVITRAKRRSRTSACAKATPSASRSRCVAQRMYEFLDRLVSAALPAHPRLPGAQPQRLRRPRATTASAFANSSSSRRSTTTRSTRSGACR